MIINDIILENRALEPLELTVIGQLKSQGKISGEMFSEVGRYLNQNQFKCLLGWLQTKNNPVVVKRKVGEGIITEEEQELFELEIISEELLSEGAFTKALQWFSNYVTKKTLKDAPGAAAKEGAKKITVPKTKPKIPTDDLVLEPSLMPAKTVKQQLHVKDMLKFEDDMFKGIQKDIRKKAGEAVDSKTIDKLAREQVKNILYKSGLTKSALKKLPGSPVGKLGSAWRKYKWFAHYRSLAVNAIMMPLRTAGLALVDQDLGDSGIGLAMLAKMDAAYKKFGELQVPGKKEHETCNSDAHKIRTILGNHGWLMSATPTGF